MFEYTMQLYVNRITDEFTIDYTYINSSEYEIKSRLWIKVFRIEPCDTPVSTYLVGDVNITVNTRVRLDK